MLLLFTYNPSCEDTRHTGDRHLGDQGPRSVLTLSYLQAAHHGCGPQPYTKVPGRIFKYICKYHLSELGEH